jgi:hypothetical protein
MHSKIDAPGGERFFDFFREHSLGANHREGYVGNLVAGGLDDFDLDFVTSRTQNRGNVIGLPERELGAAGADA